MQQVEVNMHLGALRLFSRIDRQAGDISLGNDQREYRIRYAAAVNAFNTVLSELDPETKEFRAVCHWRHASLQQALQDVLIYETLNNM